MKTENDLNEDILNLTMKINKMFPELSKYIAEMPVTIPDSNDPKINYKILKDYYDSLDALFKKYAPNHITSKL
jgi:hypothetical protein